ncbi:MAG: TRAP transporter small permease [Thermodesulfobacteriota bacterium]
MNFLEKISQSLNRLLVFAGGLVLLGMIGLTCANIFLRLVFAPVPGTFELMGYFGALATAFALGYTQVKKGHIAVDVLVDAFPARVKVLLGLANSLICCLFFILVAWQLGVKARTLWVTGELTETLKIIYYPFTFAVALGCAVLALVLLAEFFKGLFLLGPGGGK